MIPTRAVVATIPVLPIVGTTALSLGAISVLGDSALHLAGPPQQRVNVAHAEVVAVMSSLVLIALIVPPMPLLDLRRSRARMLALARLWIVLVCGAVVSCYASYCVTRGYIAEVTSLGVEVTQLPATELIVNNVLVVIGVGATLSAIMGRGAALAGTAGVIFANFLPVFFDPSRTTWPLDYMHEPGPWFSIPHVAAVATVIALAHAAWWWSAGASPQAIGAANSQK